MRTGLRLYAAIGLFALLFVPLLLSLRWPLGGGGGLAGTLTWLGLDGLVGIANSFWGLCLIAMFVLAAWSARGTYHLRKNVLRILPWAITVLTLVLIGSNLR